MEDTGGLNNGRKNYFGKFKIVYRLFGLSVDGNENLTYRIFSFLLIFIENFLFGLIRIMELFKHDKETTGTILIVPYGTMLAFAKTMVFMRNRIRVGQLLDKLEQKPFIPNPNRGGAMEEKLMDNCLRTINIQSLVFMGFTLFIILTCAILTLVFRLKSADSHDWLFPYGPITLVNVTHSHMYELWWVYENSSMFVIAIHFTIVDSTVGAVLAYVTFQFKTLQNNIKRIVEISYRDMLKETGKVENPNDIGLVDASAVPWKYLKKSLVEAINYHLEIIRAATEMEELFNGLLLYIFLNTLGLLCIAVGHPSPIMRVGGISCCLQLLVSCYWGEQMLFESQQVGKAAFQANFIGADLKFQKSLAFIIRRSQNPVIITAGKFTAVSLATFTAIIRGGYSASTVLNRVKQ